MYTTGPVEAVPLEGACALITVCVCGTAPVGGSFVRDLVMHFQHTGVVVCVAAGIGSEKGNRTDWLECSNSWYGAGNLWCIPHLLFWEFTWK